MDNKTNENTSEKQNKKQMRRWISLAMYDVLLFLMVDFLIMAIYPSGRGIKFHSLIIHTLIAGVCIFGCRYFNSIYKQVWRYGGASAYIRLFLADVAAGVIYYVLQVVLPIEPIEFIRAFSLVALNLLVSLAIRFLYLYIYQYINRSTDLSGFLWKMLEFFTGLKIVSEKKCNSKNDQTRINIAIVGAGRVGAMLADELRIDQRTKYYPCCFIDIDKSKVGREVAGLRVLSVEEATAERLAFMQVREIVFALPQASLEKRKALFEHYKNTGCKLKIYDYLMMQNAENKRRMREFDVEDLLFRHPVEFDNHVTNAYYKDKVVLITGGGGSIGSELCRQIARMKPKCLIILDVYENGAYDVQNELRMDIGCEFDLRVEILSICDRSGLDKVFREYRPDIVVHAAAHKHVPLMEHNCCEAIKNNVFGTLNVVELCEKYNVGRFMMVSTDKAVNPTNVMGATKRFCEMIVLSHSNSGSSTVYSATRFGNVLGSAGSVIPLFKKQIMNGGPITLTDKRIIRYFMTIPEASQLVLQSGAMAKNGELFVLDMGKPVKILDLAESMIKLSGYEPYTDIQIIETGLRPGEKLYEELLIKTEDLSKTENSLIFIERDEPLDIRDIEHRLEILRNAVATEDDEAAKKALRSVVPTFCSPEEVNCCVNNTKEAKQAEGQLNANIVEFVTN